ncbi:MAG: hypothetical protein ABSA86_01540 [Oryzomonas sp.]
MTHADHLSKQYLWEALHAMEQAHADNRDTRVEPHISKAIGALRELMNRIAAPHDMHGGAVSDPYEINESNSAV